MENSVDTAGIPPWRERDWGCFLPVVAYLEKWPFMCHAGLVLVLAWIAAYLHLNVALVCTLGFLFLYQVDKRQRARLLWSIGHEERHKASKMRMAEGETVRWMNQVTEKLWPMFLEDFASQMLVVPMNLFLDRFCKPWSARKVILQNLSLGKIPPIVTMVRILDETAGDDDLAMEATLEWNAAKDMAANLAVQVRRRVGFGIWTNLHICNVQLEGKVKVGMKFKPDRGWPVIERIRFCFAKAPHIDMEVRPIYNSGVDVSEVPGIASYMDHLVADALSQSLVEPNHMEIDVVRLMNDEKLVKLMMVHGSAQSPRGSWFSFGGNPPAADVIVKVMEATKLRVGDLNGYSDPYVKLILNGTQHRETKVIWKTLNPKWNETFGFSISSWDQPNTMLLKVRDKDHIFDDQLGYQIVDLNQYRDGNEHDIWLPLEAVDTGKIHLLITVVERQTDSHSSEDVSNTNSTTLEESDRPVSSEGLPIPPSPGSASSPSDRVSARQRLKNLKSRNDSASEDRSSGKKVGRQRSGAFASSPSTRRVETPRGVGSDREKPPFLSEKHSLTATRLMGAAEVADQPSTDGTTTALDVGFEEPGAIKFCQLGDREPTHWPSQWGDEPKLSEKVSNSAEGLTESLDRAFLDRENVEEDGRTPRKLRNARLALHGKFHRPRKGSEKDADTDPSSQDLQGRRGFSTTNGVTAHVTVGPSEGEPARNSCTGSPSGFDQTAAAGLSVDQGGEAVDAGVNSVGDRDAEKHHLGTKAKGLFSKAAEQLSHQISKKMNRRKKKGREEALSSDEVDTSGELTLVGESGSGGYFTTKEMVSGTDSASGTRPGPTQQQQPSTSNLPLSPAWSASVPPTRPPPGLPQPITAPLNVQRDDETTTQSSPQATHSGDA